MRVLNVSPSSPYNEGWGYQENILPKYQARNGNEVTLIVTNKEHSSSGLVDLPETDYISKNGFRVIRKAKKKIINQKMTEFLSMIDIHKELIELNPDIVFCHGLSNITIFQVLKYKRKINKNLTIVCDNHADYNIGPTIHGIKGFLEKLFWRVIHKIASSQISKVYGVTPWRMEFARDYYGVNEDKLDVLIMGADDEKLQFPNRKIIRDKIRKELDIDDQKFLIITGGKLDKKKNVIQLASAVSKIESIMLVIFGSVQDDIKDEFTQIIEHSHNIKFIGWIPADRVYDYFFASDLVFFPGQHSVLWEQACASKTPCIFKRWPGMEHVNNGGNAEFVDDVSINNIISVINEYNNTKKYKELLNNALSNKTDVYLYSKIALKSLECSKSV